MKYLIHLIFSTKHRSPWIPETARTGLYAYQAGVLQKLDSPAIVIGGVDDHVHILFSLSKNHSLSSVVEEVKKTSSKWMKSKVSANPDFSWQAGYAAFSVSQSNVARVRKYIANQPEHHRATTFIDELRAFLVRHLVTFDERHLWD